MFAIWNYILEYVMSIVCNWNWMRGEKSFTQGNIMLSDTISYHAQRRQTVTKVYNHRCWQRPVCKEFPPMPLFFTLSPTEAFHGPIVTQNVMMNSSLNSFGMQPGCLGQHEQTVVMTTSIGLLVSGVSNLHTSRFDGIEATTDTDTHIFVERLWYSRYILLP